MIDYLVYFFFFLLRGLIVNKGLISMSIPTGSQKRDPHDMSYLGDLAAKHCSFGADDLTL